MYSAIALLVSVTVFPSSISAQFTTRLQDVLSPLVESLELHRCILKLAPHTEHFAETVTSINILTGQSEANLTSLAAAARLLANDVIYCRFSPKDFYTFQELARRITARANGMETYFTLIDPVREKFPVTPAPSVPATPLIPGTPMSMSRVPSRELLHHANDSQDSVADDNLESALPISPTHRRALYASASYDTQSHSNLHRRSHGTHSPRFSIPHLPHHLLDHKLLSVSRSQKERAVGVFESQRYLNLEATSFNDPDAKTHTMQTTALLGDR